MSTDGIEQALAESRARAEALNEATKMTHVGDAFSAALAGVRVRPDAEIDALNASERWHDALKLVDRLPVWLRVWRVHRLDVCDRRLVDAASTWAADRGLILMGPTGAGKSTVAAWLFHRIVRTGVRHGGLAWHRAQGVRWLAAVELERARAEHPLGKGEAPEIRQAQSASVLFLDDAGQDRKTKAVEDVIAARYEGGLVTVVTTNLTREGMTEHYGAVTARKIREVNADHPDRKAIAVEAFR